MKRIEKDVVTSNENCYQKDAEMCGPANCKVCKTSKYKKKLGGHPVQFYTIKIINPCHSL